MFDSLPCIVENDAPALYYLQRNYPKYILIDLSDEVVNLRKSTPIEIYNDYVELAEFACRIYANVCEFYSVEDEVFDAYDYDSFCQYLNNKYNVSDIEKMYEIYRQALCSYIRGVISKLVYWRVPSFSNSGSVYLPDAFVAGTYCMNFVLSLDDR